MLQIHPYAWRLACCLVFTAPLLACDADSEGTDTAFSRAPSAPHASPNDAPSGTPAGQPGAGPSAVPMDAMAAKPPASEPNGNVPSGPALDGGSSRPGANPPAQDAGRPSAAVDAGEMPTGPLLPATDDPAARGPFDVERIDRVDGLASHSLFVPDAVGTHGKYPLVVWTNGNGGSLSTLSYASFVEHVASHGFLVIADKASNTTREAEVDSQGDAIAWAQAQNERAGGPYEGRMDLERIALMGHSLGSLASFATASNGLVATSIHFSGGITDNPVGFDPSWLQQMTQPAAFLCGGSDTTAGPSCEKDFAMAPNPVFYGVLAGASHIGPFISPRGGEYGRAAVAWLRWQLAEDPAYRAWFVGDDCVLCRSPWTGMQRDLD